MRNQLLEAIGPGAYSLLVDLFFSDAGTNLRSLFAHDEINLAELSAPYLTSDPGLGKIEPDPEGPIEEMALVLMVLYFGLCDRFQSDKKEAGRLASRYLSQIESEAGPASLSPLSPSTQPAPIDASMTSAGVSLFHECHLFINDWRSHFHPHRILGQLLQTAFGAVASCSLVLRSRSQISFPDCRLELGDSAQESWESRVQIVIEDGSAHSQALVNLWERDVRLVNLIAPLDLEWVRQHAGDDDDLPACRSQSLRAQLCSAEQPLKRAKAEKTIAQLVASISEICLSSLASMISLSASRESDPHSLSLFALLSHCQSSHTRTIAVLSHSQPELSTEAWAASLALFPERLSQFLDQLSEQMFLSLLPGVACCSQLCQVGSMGATVATPPHCCQIVKDICAETQRALVEKEELVLLGKAHTTDRRQYLIYLLALAPSESLPHPSALLNSLSAVVVNVSTFTLSLVLTSLSHHSHPSPLPTAGKIATNVFMHLFSCLSSFASCLGISREGSGGGEEKTAKKSFEKSLSQLEAALRSKHIRTLFRG
jgi:hypothetical protein